MEIAIGGGNLAFRVRVIIWRIGILSSADPIKDCGYGRLQLQFGPGGGLTRDRAPLACPLPFVTCSYSHLQNVYGWQNSGIPSKCAEARFWLRKIISPFVCSITIGQLWQRHIFCNFPPTRLDRGRGGGKSGKFVDLFHMERQTAANWQVGVWQLRMRQVHGFLPFKAGSQSTSWLLKSSTRFEEEGKCRQ